MLGIRKLSLYAYKLTASEIIERLFSCCQFITIPIHNLNTSLVCHAAKCMDVIDVYRDNPYSQHFLKNFIRQF